MPSPNTIKLQRDRMLSRLLSVKVMPAKNAGPNREQRRKMLQNFARETGIPYTAQRDTIRDVEKRMRAHGIDPYSDKSYERLLALEKEEEKYDRPLQSFAHFSPS